MKEENLIHIKLDYGEAIQSRKDVLYTEMDLLRILKIIQKYHLLRSKELEIKLQIYKKLKEIKTNITHIENIFPKLKMPKLLKNPQKELEETKPKRKKPLKIKKEKTPKYSNEIENQLKAIQKKLSKLS